MRRQENRPPAWIVLAVLLAAGTADASDETGPEFAPPVRLKAGEKWLGEKRLYPSPVIHDVNGDGTRDVIVGDLPGRITFASFVKGEGGAMTLAAEKPLMSADGKPLKFHNW
ncbi:MAG: hypothetical protein ACYTDX_10340 [Planctomycetota bacterium]|jgi:hypothetical protein